MQLLMQKVQSVLLTFDAEISFGKTCLFEGKSATGTKDILFHVEVLMMIDDCETFKAKQT